MRLVAFVVKPRDDSDRGLPSLPSRPSYQITCSRITSRPGGDAAHGERQARPEPLEREALSVPELGSKGRTPPGERARTEGRRSVRTRPRARNRADRGGRQLLRSSAAIPSGAWSRSKRFRARDWSRDSASRPVRERNGPVPSPTTPERGPAESRPILLGEKSSGPPLFMLSGIHIYRELARRLNGQCSSYGVFTRRELGAFVPASGFHSVEDLARDYCRRSSEASSPRGRTGCSGIRSPGSWRTRWPSSFAPPVRRFASWRSSMPSSRSGLLGWRFRLSQIARLWHARRATSRLLREAPARKLGAADCRLIAALPRRQEAGSPGGAEDAANRDAAAHYMPDPPVRRP